MLEFNIPSTCEAPEIVVLLLEFLITLPPSPLAPHCKIKLFPVLLLNIKSLVAADDENTPAPPTSPRAAPPPVKYIAVL